MVFLGGLGMVTLQGRVYNRPWNEIRMLTPSSRPKPIAFGEVTTTDNQANLFSQELRFILRRSAYT